MGSLILTVAALLALPGAASADLKDMGRASAVTADGGRYAVIMRPGRDAPIVLDDSSPAPRALPDAPAGCSEPVLHGVRLIVGCATTEASGWYAPRAWDVRDGAAITLAGLDAVQREFTYASWAGKPTWGPLGAQRVVVSWAEYHNRFSGTLDWRTGELYPELRDGPRSIVDVDSPLGYTDLCDPLTRTVDPDYVPNDPYGEGEPAFLPMAYAPPWALQRNDLDQLVLLHCGHRLLVRVLAGGRAAALAGRTAAWQTGKRLHVLDLRDMSDRSWATSRPLTGLAVTRAHVYALAGGRLFRGDVPLSLPREPKPAHTRVVVRGQGCRATDRAELVSRGAGLRRRLVPAGARGVRLCRYAPLRLSATRTLGSARARELTRRFDSLGPPPRGAVACPNDDGSQIVALFRYARRAPVAVTTALTGCPTARNGVVVADASASLVARLEQTVPLPR